MNSGLFTSMVSINISFLNSSSFFDSLPHLIETDNAKEDCFQSDELTIELNGRV